jgi:hypothetical protein
VVAVVLSSIHISNCVCSNSSRLEVQPLSFIARHLLLTDLRPRGGVGTVPEAAASLLPQLSNRPSVNALAAVRVVMPMSGWVSTVTSDLPCGCEHVRPGPHGVRGGDAHRPRSRLRDGAEARAASSNAHLMLDGYLRESLRYCP